MIAESLHGITMCCGKPHRLLVVDDSPLIRLAVRRMFENEGGWKVCYEAVSGDDAIDKARLHQPCAIVIDMFMPGMDGFEVARELRAIAPDTPVLMFTNFAEEKFMENEILKAGIKRVVSKTDARGLVAAVNSVVAA